VEGRRLLHPEVAQALQAWWESQRRFTSKEELAAALQVKLAALGSVCAGSSFPRGPNCWRFYEITGLQCFRPEESARWEERCKRKAYRLTRAYQRKHRAELLARQQARWERFPELRERRLTQYRDSRQRHQRRITPAELRLLQEDPTRRFRMARPARGQKITPLTTVLTDLDIVCLQCGAILVALGAHLKAHGLGTRAYRQRWGYNRRTPLCSVKLSQRKSVRRKKAGLQPPQTTRLGTELGAPRGRTVGEKMRLEYRVQQAERKRGRGLPSRWKATDGRIVQLVLQQRSLSEIAAQVGMTRHALAARLRRLGFPRFGAGPYQLRHGEVLATRQLRDACEDFDLKPPELARQMGLPLSKLRLRLKHGRVDAPLALAWARKLQRVQRRLRRERVPRPASSRGGRPRELLPSEEKCIRRQYRKLLQDQVRLRQWFENFEGRISRRTQKLLLVWLCEQRRLGKIQVLLFWPEFFLWLERTFHQSYLQGNPIARLGKPLTLDFLARSFHVSVRTIERVLWPGSPATR